MNHRERFLATMNYQARDRCPWGKGVLAGDAGADDGRG
jgi:hypothetical protein